MEVDKILFDELKALGFSDAEAKQGLHFTGNSSIEDAVSWLVDRQNDTAVSAPPMAVVGTEASCPPYFSEQVESRAQARRNRASEKKAEQEKKLEREREKERSRADKVLLMAKLMEEKHERQRFLAQKKAEMEEGRRAAMDKIRQDKERIRADKELLKAKWVEEKNEGERFLAQMKAAMEDERRALLDKICQDKERIRADKELLNAKLVEEKNESERCLAQTKADMEEERRALVDNTRQHKDEVGKSDEGVKSPEQCVFEKVDGSRCSHRCFVAFTILIITILSCLLILHVLCTLNTI